MILPTGGLATPTAMLVPLSVVAPVLDPEEHPLGLSSGRFAVMETRGTSGPECRRDLELASQKTAVRKFAQYSGDAVDGHRVTTLEHAHADGSSK